MKEKKKLLAYARYGHSYSMRYINNYYLNIIFELLSWRVFFFLLSQVRKTKSNLFYDIHFANFTFII